MPDAISGGAGKSRGLDPDRIVESLRPRGDEYELPKEWAECLSVNGRRESPSSIVSFLSCPMKWYLERYAPGPDEPDYPSIWSLIGTFVHRVLETYYNEPPHLRTPEHLESLFETAWRELVQGGETPLLDSEIHRGWNYLKESGDVRTPKQIGFFRSRAKTSALGVLAFDSDPAEIDVIATESWVSGEVGEQGAGQIRINGKIDRLDRGPFGEDVVDYKGLAIDTPIPTPTGWTTMAALQVGDRVLGTNGKPVLVTKKSQIHHRPCYQITFLDGSSVICDNVHLWEVDESTPSGNIVRNVTDTDSLYRAFRRLAEDWRLHSIMTPLTIRNPLPLQLPAVELPIDPWLLGAWLGNDTNNEGMITTSSVDYEDMLVLIKESWQGDVSDYPGIPPETHYIYLGPSEDTPQLANLLEANNLIENRHIPSRYLRSSQAQRLSLLQGLMDANGSWHSLPCRAVFVTTNPNLADNVRELVVTLGGTPYLHKQPCTDKTSYTVEFKPVGFSPFRLPRKASLVDDLCSNEQPELVLRRTIISMKPIDSVPTQCIQVDSSDSLYLAGPLMVPTHNTGRAPQDEDVDPFAIKNIPVGIYALLRQGAKSENDLVPVRSVQLFYLYDSVRIVFKASPERMAVVTQLLESVVKWMANAADKGCLTISPAKASSEYPCCWCPAIDICPAWNESHSVDEMIELMTAEHSE